MDEDLRQYLVAMEARIAAKREVSDARLLDAVSEKIYKTETKLLTEFHKWASPEAAKTRTHRAWLNEVDIAVESLKDRLEKLEGERPPQ